MRARAATSPEPAAGASAALGAFPPWWPPGWRAWTTTGAPTSPSAQGAIDGAEKALTAGWDWSTGERVSRASVLPNGGALTFQPMPARRRSTGWRVQPGYARASPGSRWRRPRPGRGRSRRARSRTRPGPSTATETGAVGRAVRLALYRDETWLPDVLDGLVRGIAVAPTQAKTLPSHGAALRDRPRGRGAADPRGDLLLADRPPDRPARGRDQGARPQAQAHRVPRWPNGSTWRSGCPDGRLRRSRSASTSR